jgi:hypothetical protein
VTRAGTAGRSMLGHDAGVDPDPPAFPPGSPRRRLGNFRTQELASRVQAVLAEAGIPSSAAPDTARPDRWGRLLDRLVYLTGAGGHRVWVPRERLREAARALTEARRRGV